MDFEVWERYYKEILLDFGFDRSEDERAASTLSKLLKHKDLATEDMLSHLIEGKDAAVAGGAGHLEQELEENPSCDVLIAADGTTSVLMGKSLIPDVIVTDLDGRIQDQIEANRQGAIITVHAHGDNILQIERYVPQFTGKIIGTVQCRPYGKLRNFGGFTDGDRAAILAAHFGAKSIRLVGFDFDEVGEKAGGDKKIKKRKLKWARKLIDSLDIPVMLG
jgi:uncharacterized Rossmann fold enzyme